VLRALDLLTPVVYSLTDVTVTWNWQLASSKGLTLYI
jgi:hypothetical protein